MVKSEDEGFLLTFDEIRILLYAYGVREIKGICMPEKNFTDADIVRALHHMTDQGFITADGEEFVVKKQLDAILKIMCLADRSYLWSPAGDGTPAFYCYDARDGVVVSELFWKKKETLKLRLFSQEEFRAWKEKMSGDYCGN